jgi:hypothetical protein
MCSQLNHSIRLLNKRHHRQNVAQDAVVVTMVAQLLKHVNDATIAAIQLHRVAQVWAKELLEANHLVGQLSQQSKFNLVALTRLQSLDTFNEC